MANPGWDSMAPKPRTLEEANAEVLRLRIALAVSNQRWGRLWEKYQLDMKSMKGQLEAHRQKLVEIGKLLLGTGAFAAARKDPPQEPQKDPKP